MYILLVVLHVLSCLILIAVVLLQSGKGGDLSTAFGASSETLFGTHAGTFLSKTTTIVAIVFMVTSLTLAIVTSKGVGFITK